MQKNVSLGKGQMLAHGNRCTIECLSESVYWPAILVWINLIFIYMLLEHVSAYIIAFLNYTQNVAVLKLIMMQAVLC